MRQTAVVPRAMRRLVTFFTLLAGLLAVAVQPAAAQVARDPVEAAPAAPAAASVNVAIQAGHWKSAELPDPLARLRASTGAVAGGRTESQVNLDIAQRAAALLRAQGLSVEILPATIPTGYSADLFISLHMDGNPSARARGFKASTRWRSDVAALDAYLMDSLTGSYANVTGLPENPSVTQAMRGYYAYSTYHGEEYRLGSATPAAILEMGFISSAADRAVVFNQPNRVAQGIVAGINAFYARLVPARRVQALAERAAAQAPSNRSAVILGNSANLRAEAADTARRLGSAVFGDSLSLLTTPNIRPTGGRFDPQHGTQLVTGSGWYKVALPGTDTPAYISRDLVVVQQ